MKKMTIMCMAALLLMAVSCKKEKANEEYTGEGFRATTESHTDDGNSKTHLEGLSVKWDNNDAILVASSTCTTPKRFTTCNPQNVGYDLFVADETLPGNFYTPDYMAYYPAAKFSGNQFTLPATQTYAENTFANGANPMAAISTTTELPFRNLCGILKFQLYSATSCTVKSLRVTSLKEGEQLWGMGTVTFDGQEATLGALSNGGASVVLDCGEEGVDLNGEPTEFLVVIPGGALSEGFKLTVTDAEGQVWSRTAPAADGANKITKSKIKAMPELPVVPTDPVTPSTVTLTAGCSTENIYNVGGSVTVPDGEHTCEFGLVYSATNTEPTVADTKVVAGTAAFSGTKTFTADITGLTVGTTYHVRTYAIIDDVTYSTTVEDIVGGNTPLPLPRSWTNNGGKNPHPFTVGEGNKVVYFSQGNLQYRAVGGSAGNASATAEPGESVGGTWRFAEHQFDFIGADNKNAAQTYGGWIDQFGWGTSGYNHGATCYQPWSMGNSLNYPSQYYAYGVNNKNLEDGPVPDPESRTGKADWGKANTISNGGTNSWRTLTGSSGGEWFFLINSRTDAANLYGMGKVGNCTPGLIILPDGWSWSGDVEDFGPNAAEESRKWKPGKTAWSNVYSYSEWSLMEAAGAVFLPAAGYRNGTSLNLVGSYAYYWSSSYYNATDAYYLDFGINYGGSPVVYPGNSNSFRDRGFSVRLVTETPPTR